MMNNDIVIKTERLTLVPLGTQFIDSTFRYATDPANTGFMVHMPKASREEVSEFLEYAENEWNKETPSFYEFAVLFDNDHIGSVSVYFNDSFDSGEIGYIIDKNYHNRGFAYESAKSVIDMCATNGIKSFTAHCDSENFASIRVLEKLGMEFVSSKFGRKNRSSDEIRTENSYKLDL
ncbi:MAG: GNAT family N-acetyltransferase [Clostridia bacterium]|nr:GNAT family N-acetyltransferase [Clostridia bacterium]